MADLANKPNEGEQAKTPKQDTREEMMEKMKALREKVYPMLEEKDADPRIVERVNQIMNDAMAALPPDPRPDPVYQRATLTTTMSKIRTQVEAALASFSSKPEEMDKYKQPFVEAEEEAKKSDEEKGVPPPAGPSQSPQDTQRQAYEHPVQEDAPEPEQQYQQPA